MTQRTVVFGISYLLCPFGLFGYYDVIDVIDLLTSVEAGEH